MPPGRRGKGRAIFSFGNIILPSSDASDVSNDEVL